MVREIEKIVHKIRERQEDVVTCNLYLTNLATSVTESALRAVAAAHGRVVSVKIMVYPNYRTGFVEYMSRKEAERGLAALQNYALDGLPLHVTWARPLATKPPAAPQAPSVDTGSVQVEKPADARLRAQIRAVAGFVALYGSRAEQLLFEAVRPSWMIPDQRNPVYLYYLNTVICECYALRGQPPPALVRLNEYEHLSTTPDDEDSKVPLAMAEARDYYARLGEIDVVDYTNLAVDQALKTVSRDRESVKRTTITIVENVKLQHPVEGAYPAQAAVRLLLLSPRLDQKIALLYVIHDLVCNSLVRPTRYMEVLRRVLPRVMDHLHQYRCEIMLSKAYQALAIWKECSVFTPEIVRGYQCGLLGGCCARGAACPHANRCLANALQKAVATGPSPPPGPHDGKSCQDRDYEANMQACPVPVRDKFSDVYRIRDDIWSLRRAMDINGLYFHLTDPAETLMRRLMGYFLFAKTTPPDLGQSDLTVDDILHPKKKRLKATELGHKIEQLSQLNRMAARDKIEHAVREAEPLPATPSHPAETAEPPAPVEENETDALLDSIMSEINEDADDSSEDMFALASSESTRQTSRMDLANRIIEKHVMAQSKNLEPGSFETIAFTDDLRRTLQARVYDRLSSQGGVD